ncbi:DnaJ family domain-containing protein [Gymnodinialimonas sp.]
MSHWFEKLAERHMRKAQAEGKLSGLAGEGKPLPDHPEAAHIDAAEAVGFRLMAEHGAVPEEIRLRQARDAARAAYQDAPEADKKAAMARLAEAEMKLSIVTEARMRAMRST